MRFSFLLFFLMSLSLFSHSKELKIGKISFLDSSEAGLLASKKNGKKILLFFSDSHCLYCKNLKFEFSKELIQDHSEYLNFVYINVGRQYDEASAYSIKGTPHLVLLDSEGGVIKEKLGAIKAPDLLAFISEKVDNKKKRALKKQQLEDGLFGPLDWSPEGFRQGSVCYSNVGFGPLRLSTQSPLQSIRPAYQPRTPSTLKQGQMEVHTQSTWANIWSEKEDHYLLDMETFAYQFSLAYGFKDLMQIELQYDQKSRFGGKMDGFIQGFHDVFDIDQSGRTDVPKEDFTVFFSDGKGSPPTMLGLSEKGMYSHDLNLTYSHSLTCGGYYYPAIAYSVSARYSIWSRGDFEIDFPIDLSASVSFSRRMRDFYTYVSLGFAIYGKTKIKTGNDRDYFKMKRTQISALIAEEWRLNSRMSLVLQYLFTEGALRDFDPFSKASHEITFGFSWEFRPMFVFQMGLIENLFVFDNSPDFGVFGSTSIRF